MSSLYRICLVGLVNWLIPPTLADEADSVFEDQAAALLAVQLSSEMADELRQDFVRQGKTLDDADALAFRTIDEAAVCSVKEFSAHKTPQIQSYFDLH